MKADRSGRVLASMLVTLLLLGGCATGGSPGGSSQSPAQARRPAHPAASRGAIGVGVGTGGVRVGGRVSPATTDPVSHYTMMGFILGSAGGPIGSGIGALVGYFHGRSEKKKIERQARLESDRQKKLDQELEGQILAQRGGAAASVPAPVLPAEPQRGVIFVEDHLDEARALPGGSSATDLSEPGVVVVEDHLAPSPPAKAPESSARPTPEPGSPARTRTSTLARIPAAGIDREGFKAIYEDSRVVRRERDLDDDGKPDVVVHYGSDGQPIRREESSQLDGRIDTWTFYANGKAERKEADTDGDGGVDLWAFYGPEGELVRLKSLVDRRRSLTQFYEEGTVVSEEWRREPGGQLRARQKYRDGKVREKEEDSGGNGQLDLVSVFDAQGQLVKQGRRGGDGRMVAWRYFDPKQGTLLRQEEIGERGEVVAVSHYQRGKLARRELYELKDELFRRVPLLSERESRGGG
ncbi:MAG: hypothetical protein ACE5MG_11465 [Candidatus Methylomirabilales bacterium]